MSYIYPIRVGELSFTNTVPFRLAGRWHPMPCPSPRLLARWADEDRIDAGVLPVVEAWRLADRFESLSDFGIAVRDRAGSVILFSRRPWVELDERTVGVTDQTSTSARLLRLLLEKRDGKRVAYRQGFHESDDARLLIGDAALAPDPRVTGAFPHAYDLGAEWHAWQGAPFVFARWMIRKTVPDHIKAALADALGAALTRFGLNAENICRQSARFLKLPSQALCDYMSGFIYRLGAPEDKAEKLFRDLLSSVPTAETRP